MPLHSWYAMTLHLYKFELGGVMPVSRANIETASVSVLRICSQTCFRIGSDDDYFSYIYCQFTSMQGSPILFSCRSEAVGSPSSAI